MNYSKYHYVAGAKPKALLTKFLSKLDKDRFWLNYFNNFETDKKLKNIKRQVKKPSSSWIGNT